MNFLRAPFAPLMWAVALVAAAIDQLSKIVVLHTLTPGVDVPVIGSFARLRLLFNPGAAFSIGTNLTWVFTILQFSFAAVILFYGVRKVEDRLTAVALALIAGGALGNLFDRLFRAPGFFVGHVVDFISVGSFAVFNIADSCITVGVALMIIGMIVTETRSKRAEESQQ